MMQWYEGDNVTNKRQRYRFQWLWKMNMFNSHKHLCCLTPYVPLYHLLTVFVLANVMFWGYMEEINSMNNTSLIFRLWSAWIDVLWVLHGWNQAWQSCDTSSLLLEVLTWQVHLLLQRLTGVWVQFYREGEGVLKFSLTLRLSKAIILYIKMKNRKQVHDNSKLFFLTCDEQSVCGCEFNKSMFNRRISSSDVGHWVKSILACGAHWKGLRV